MNTEIFEKIPAQDSESARQLGEELAAGGAATVKQLIELVGDEFGDPKGAKPKYALHGLTHYVSRPGADAQRRTVAQTLAEELSADHSDELKVFIVRQLQLCGGAEEVPTLAKHLSSDFLCNPATQALAAIGGQKALTALRGALPTDEGSRKVAISQAIEFISRN